LLKWCVWVVEVFVHRSIPALKLARFFRKLTLSPKHFALSSNIHSNDRSQTNCKHSRLWYQTSTHGSPNRSNKYIIDKSWSTSSSEWNSRVNSACHT
jgi:hypothetical protein